MYSKPVWVVRVDASDTTMHMKVCVCLLKELFKNGPIIIKQTNRAGEKLIA